LRSPSQRHAWRSKECKTCEGPFTSSRGDARFCSARCRKYFNKHRQPYPQERIDKLRALRAFYNPATKTIPGMEDTSQSEDRSEESKTLKKKEVLKSGGSQSTPITDKRSATTMNDQTQPVRTGQSQNVPAPGSIRPHPKTSRPRASKPAGRVTEKSTPAKPKPKKKVPNAGSRKRKR
jgi:hypothetical protein